MANSANVDDDRQTLDDLTVLQNVHDYDRSTILNRASSFDTNVVQGNRGEENVHKGSDQTQLGGFTPRGALSSTLGEAVLTDRNFRAAYNELSKDSEIDTGTAAVDVNWQNANVLTAIPEDLYMQISQIPAYSVISETERILTPSDASESSFEGNPQFSAIGNPAETAGYTINTSVDEVNLVEVPSYELMTDYMPGLDDPNVDSEPTGQATDLPIEEELTTNDDSSNYPADPVGSGSGNDTNGTDNESQVPEISGNEGGGTESSTGSQGENETNDQGSGGVVVDDSTSTGSDDVVISPPDTIDNTTDDQTGNNNDDPVNVDPPEPPPIPDVPEDNSSGSDDNSVPVDPPPPPPPVPEDNSDSGSGSEDHVDYPDDEWDHGGHSEGGESTGGGSGGGSSGASKGGLQDHQDEQHNNNGWGNGDQEAPGASADHNNAENSKEKESGGHSVGGGVASVWQPEPDPEVSYFDLSMGHNIQAHEGSNWTDVLDLSDESRNLWVSVGDDVWKIQKNQDGEIDFGSNVSGHIYSDASGKHEIAEFHNIETINY